jgi:NAD(P)-dependent dehydrogenase (short-subunit alcohol dehydrogenase family)
LNPTASPPSSPNPSADRGLALVTGGAHRLGRAIALGLARLGYAVVVHYHHSAAAAEQTAAAARALGTPAVLLDADLRDPAQIQGLFDRIAGLPYPLKVLVNSAAVMPRGSLVDISPADWDAALALNLRAPLLCSQQAARLMIDGGVIVNLTDTGAQKTWTSFPAYVVSKSALETLTRLLARSLAPRIRVNAVAPGLVLPGPDTPPEDWDRLVARIPLKRAALVDEIAQTVAFLVQNEYITGQTVVVDGGYHLI